MANPRPGRSDVHSTRGLKMTADDSLAAARLLGEAAALLNVVGADRDRVPGNVAADCRRAAELLLQAGDLPATDVHGADDPRTTARQAMAALSKLSDAHLSSEPTRTAVLIIWRVYLRVG